MRLSKISIIGIIALLLFSPLAVAQSWPNPGHPAGQVGGGTFNSSYGNFLFPSGVNVTADSTTFHVDATGDKVGIGTTTPATKFTVVGNLNATGIVLATNCNDGQILKWASGVGACGSDLNSGGSMTSWNIAGDSGSDSVSDGQTATVAGGTNGIDTSETGRTVTVSLDWTEVGSDAIAESKIDFDTACTGNNKLQTSGNDLSCVAEGDPEVGTVTSSYACYGIASNVVECNDAAFYWDSGNNRLGIGGTPDVDLQVVKDSGNFRLSNTAKTQSTTMIGSYGWLTIRPSLATYGLILYENDSAQALYFNQVDGVGYISSDTNIALQSSSGSVGIGTVSPAAKLHVQGGSIIGNATGAGTFVSGTGVYGTGSGYGVYGYRDSTNYGFLGNGTLGVYGTGSQYGVYGYGTGTLEGGVYGTNGDVYGALGISPWMNVDAGCYGNASGTAGVNNYGVLGLAYADSYNIGVVGTLDTTTLLYDMNVAVLGRYDSSNYGYLGSSSFGVFGNSSGTGVYGEGQIYGGYFLNNHTGTEYGVYSAATGASTNNYGVYGLAGSAGTDNFGVLGSAIGTAGDRAGVVGRAGTFAGTTGSAIGVYGTTATGSVTIPAGVNLSGYFITSPVSIGLTTLMNKTNINGDGDLYASGAVEFDGLAQATSAYTVYWQPGGAITRTSSSRRFKEDIKDYSFDTDKIGQLRPVTFTYNNISGSPGTRTFGLIAEEVAEVFPELVGYDENGSPDSVAYDRLGVILTKGYQEQERKIAEQQTEITQLKEQDAKREQELLQLREEIADLKLSVSGTK